MGEKTGISWTESTWNCWQGCHKISAGCKNCYMYRDKKRYGQDPTKVIRSSKATFEKPLTWKDGRLIFVCSWSDFFIEEADAWRQDAWKIIRETPRHTYQILTKRPELVKDRLPMDWGKGYENVWLGVTCENQEMANLRIPLLLDIPLKLKFVSVEPMLTAVDLEEYNDIDWVICGCESGGNRRETKVEWVRDLRDQCGNMNIPFFLKQADVNGKLVKMPLLDGKVYGEMPE